MTFLAVGVVAGLAVGAFLADRLGGVGGISARVRGRMRGSRGGPSLTGESPPDLRAQPGTEDDEDTLPDYEEAVQLAPSEGDEIDGTWGNSTEVVGEDEDEEMADDDTEQPFASADPDLEDRVLAAFTNDPVLCERAIDIGAITAQTIELTGMVLTDEEYEHATVVTRGVPGVETVVNRLSVRQDDATKEQAARRYAAGDPRYTEARWENERVGTGRPRQGTSQDVGRHADPKVPLESRTLDAAEAVRDAADDIPPALPTRKRDDDRRSTGEAEAR